MLHPSRKRSHRHNKKRLFRFLSSDKRDTLSAQTALLLAGMRVSPSFRRGALLGLALLLAAALFTLSSDEAEARGYALASNLGQSSNSTANLTHDRAQAFTTDPLSERSFADGYTVYYVDVAFQQLTDTNAFS